MTIVSTTPFVAVLCLAGALAGAVLVRVLERRRPTLRAKFIALFGLRASGVDGWIVATGYAADRIAPMKWGNIGFLWYDCPRRIWRTRRDSNSRPLPSEGSALSG